MIGLCTAAQNGICTYRLNWARRASWGWWDEYSATKQSEAQQSAAQDDKNVKKMSKYKESIAQCSAPQNGAARTTSCIMAQRKTAELHFTSWWTTVKSPYCGRRKIPHLGIKGLYLHCDKRLTQPFNPKGDEESTEQSVEYVWIFYWALYVGTRKNIARVGTMLDLGLPHCDNPGCVLIQIITRPLVNRSRGGGAMDK